MQRRPMKTRGKAWAQALARSLARCGFTPNQISMASLVFAALAAGALAWGGEAHAPGALCLGALCVQGRLLCNMLDGLVAVEQNKRTLTGDLFNEIPDRVADVLILVAVGCAVRHAPMALAMAWAAALLAVLTAYIRLLGAAVGTPQFFVGPMAKPQRMALVTAAALCEAALPPVAGVPYLYSALGIIVAGCVITCARRVRRIVTALGQGVERPHAA